MISIAVDDHRLGIWCPREPERSRGQLRLERFDPAARDSLAGQIGPLANLRSSSGCAVVLRTDAPTIALQLARLRHHQPVDQAIDCCVYGDDGRLASATGVELRDREGDTTVILTTGLERGGALAHCWLLLPTISTCAIAGIELPDGSQVEAARLPQPRWLAIGDSFTQGFSVPRPSATWLHRLARRRGLPAWNLGVGGLKIEPELFADAIAARDWRLITVGLGSNHAWRDADTHDVAARAQGLCAALSATSDTQVAWILPPWKALEDGAGPPDFFGVPLDQRAADRVQRIRADLRQVLADFPAITLIDDVVPHDPRLLPDGLHPSAYGASLIAERIDEQLPV